MKSKETFSQRGRFLNILNKIQKNAFRRNTHHKISNEGEMAVVDADSIYFEYVVDFTDHSSARGLNTIHLVDLIGERSERS